MSRIYVNSPLFFAAPISKILCSTPTLSDTPFAASMWTGQKGLVYVIMYVAISSCQSITKRFTISSCITSKATHKFFQTQFPPSVSVTFKISEYGKFGQIGLPAKVHGSTNDQTYFKLFGVATYVFVQYFKPKQSSKIFEKNAIFGFNNVAKLERGKVGASIDQTSNRGYGFQIRFLKRTLYN